MSEPHGGNIFNIPQIRNSGNIAGHSNESIGMHQVADNHAAAPSTSVHSQQPTDTARRTINANHQRPPNATNDTPFTNGDLIDLCDHTGENDDPNAAAESQRQHLVEAINEQLLHDLNRKMRRSEDVTVGSDEQRGATTPNHVAEVNALSATRPYNLQSIEQHQTAIREFKRLGTYCTLRPDQRRKHLLNVLPNLRKSVLLQTLLAANLEQTSAATENNASRGNGNNSSNNNNNNSNSNDSGWAYNDVDSLLIELDDFLIDRNTMIPYGPKADNAATNECTQSHRNDINSNHCANDTNGLAMQSCAVDKVEDCLLELDAYLEEIDREYAWACAGSAHSRVISSIANIQDSRGVHQANVDAAKVCDNDAITVSAVPVGRCQRSNSDVCMTSDNDDDNDDADSDDSCDECTANARATMSSERRRTCEQHSHCRPLRRGYKLRRTIAAFDACGTRNKPNISALSASGEFCSARRSLGHFRSSLSQTTTFPHGFFLLL